MVISWLTSQLHQHSTIAHHKTQINVKNRKRPLFLQGTVWNEKQAWAEGEIEHFKRSRLQNNRSLLIILVPIAHRAVASAISRQYMWPTYSVHNKSLCRPLVVPHLDDTSLFQLQYFLRDVWILEMFSHCAGILWHLQRIASSCCIG